VIGFKRRDDEFVEFRVEVEAQTADVTPVAFARLRLRLELSAPKDGVARGAVPRHGHQITRR
jgi:hypothetical protein